MTEPATDKISEQLTKEIARVSALLDADGLGPRRIAELRSALDSARALQPHHPTVRRLRALLTLRDLK